MPLPRGQSWLFSFRGSPPRIAPTPFRFDAEGSSTAQGRSRSRHFSCPAGAGRARAARSGSAWRLGDVGLTLHPRGFPRPGRARSPFRFGVRDGVEFSSYGRTGAIVTLKMRNFASARFSPSALAVLAQQVLAVRPGFEPRQKPPKGLVLPLHHRTDRANVTRPSPRTKLIQPDNGQRGASRRPR